MVKGKSVSALFKSLVTSQPLLYKSNLIMIGIDLSQFEWLTSALHVAVMETSRYQESLSKFSDKMGIRLA
jgi:hypothetical protein